MRIIDYHPEKTRKYDLDIPEDLLAVLGYAFAYGVAAKRDGHKPLRGQAILELFIFDCAGIHYRQGHIRWIKMAFTAGWDCVDMVQTAQEWGVQQ